MKREAEITFLRYIPGTTVVHRFWAGTKLLIAFELALALSISPTWPMLALTTAVVAIELLVARIPLGAFPRLPGWFFVAMAIGAGVSMLSNAEPMLSLGVVQLSVGGLADWARFTAVAIVLISSGAVVGWTTPLGDVAPALSTLLRPLRWIRLPVDEWIVAIALAIRCLPLMVDEMRTLLAVRRLRAHVATAEAPKASLMGVLVEGIDILSTAIVLSIRRARDLADAMVSRGGIHGGVSATRTRLGIADVIALLAVTALCVVAVGVLHL
jgi:energy-coupling factor transporter transmembrane protein EcfT